MEIVISTPSCYPVPENVASIINENFKPFSNRISNALGTYGSCRDDNDELYVNHPNFWNTWESLLQSVLQMSDCPIDRFMIYLFEVLDLEFPDWMFIEEDGASQLINDFLVWMDHVDD